jgi:uroporphyrin-III C-methyltransferase
MNSKVFFIGAGPGDPELITIKGVNVLKDSEVVIYDRLVNEKILELYCDPNVKKIFVGKQGHTSHSTPQSEINSIILNETEKHEKIARLKGGDVSIFANIVDELEILYQNNIPFEIIPGITSASGMSAYTGIPLTARDLSRGVRFLTFLSNENISQSLWEDFTNTSDTLIFYMSTKYSKYILQNLKNRNCDKPFAFIQNATSIYQKVIVSNIQDYEEIEIPRNTEGPTLFIIGEVVKYYEKFKWFQEEKQGSLFALL